MKDPKYDSLSHSKFKIRYHIIFSTKYRKNLLVGIIASKIKEYMKLAESQQSAWQIEIMEIDSTKPNHIHLLVKSTPSIAPYEIIHKLKQVSTYMVWKEFNHYMKRWYWSEKHYLWTRGYFCSSIGDVCTKNIMSYIENQG